ncbi:MAG: hypothetical protein QXJ93_00315 [Candidatus Rehaiarchaeum fermentans]|nr:hypothetical protein [Candidatus Rehaiarchaeum fermentans]
MSKSVIATLNIKGYRFEILVDPDEAIKIKFDNKGDIRKALLVDRIFKDARKGDEAGNLEKFFNTNDVYKIAEKIIKEGELPVPSEFKKKQTEALKKRIIDEISKEVIDANTHLPIPPSRIELAVEKVGFNFNLSKNPNELKKELIEKLKTVLPIKSGVQRYSISADNFYFNQLIPFLKKNSDVIKIEKGDKSFVAEVEIQLVKVNEVIGKVNAITNNSAIISKI